MYSICIQGAYFVCNDGNLKPINSDCIVLSFGVNTNDAFEKDISEKLDCLVHSFDPFIQPPRVEQIKQARPHMKKNVTIEIKPNWFFHSIGITNGERIRDRHTIGWLDTYEHILDYIGLRGKVIDVFKLDAEGAEWYKIKRIYREIIGKVK